MSKMEPTLNDVLSGRGAWFNNHPGNKHFRKIMEEQKAVYMTGTKKQKMDMSKAIVEAIYSKEPPGRFLKQCPETGQWNELSKREAADKAAQAMAYAVKGEYLKQRRRERRMRSCPLPSLNEGAASSQTSDRPTHNRLDGNVASSVARHGLAACGQVGGCNAESVSAGNDARQASNDEMVPVVPGNSNLQLQQQLLPQLQQSSSITLPSTAGAPLSANENGLVEVLAQAVQQQRRHYQQQQQQQQQQQLLLFLQHSLWRQGQFQTTQQLPPASFEGLVHLLAQAQPQQQQPIHLQPLQPLQRVTGQNPWGLPNSLPSSASFPPTQSLSVPPSALQNDSLHHQPSSNFFLTGSQPANSNILRDHVQPQQQSLPSNELLLGMFGNFQSQPNLGTSNSPQQAQQMDQAQGILQQQQLLASSLIVSNQERELFQQQSLPLDPIYQARQTALLHQNNNNSQYPPPTNALPSTNTAATSYMQDGSEDEEQSGSEDDQARVQPYEQV